jgi:hypothetical protein
MYQTYELYIRESPEAAARFRPLTCRDRRQAMEIARELLKDQAAGASVEVRLAGEHLFSFER